MSLTNKQIKFLKKEAHHLNPIFQIGKNGITTDVLAEIDQALEKRELIKVQVLQNAIEEPKEIRDFIEENSQDIKVIQVIGKVLVLYKSSSYEENRDISDQVRAIH